MRGGKGMQKKWKFRLCGKGILAAVLTATMLMTLLTPMATQAAEAGTLEPQASGTATSGGKTSAAAEAQKAHFPRFRILKKAEISSRTPSVGDVLTADVKPADATVRYSWRCGLKEIGRDQKCRVSSALKGKRIHLIVSGTGNTLGIRMDHTEKVTGAEVPPRDPYVRIEAESFDESFGEGMVVEDSVDGGKNIGGTRDGYYTGYRNVHFGYKAAESVMFRASSSSGGTVEVRLDGPDGRLLGSCSIPSTGSWEDYQTFHTKIEQVKGIQDIFLVFRGKDYLVNLNWIQFFTHPTRNIRSVRLDKDSPVAGDTLHGILTPEDAMVRYIWKADGKEVGYNDHYTVSVGDIGKKIELEVTGIGDYKGTKTSNRTHPVQAPDYGVDFKEMAYDGFTAFIDKYYQYDEEKDIHRFGGFWTGAEMFEIVVDAYSHTGEARYKEMMDQIHEGFLVDQKGYEVDGWWGKNDYNDDIMWIVIACARSYLATGDTKYLETARINFDNTYKRAWSDDLGGGLFWRVDNQGKNACVNGPGAIAACLLGTALGDESYFEKAKAIMDWEREVLFDPETGHVDDCIGMDGVKSTWASTYNQGTFIGANCMLYEHYGDERYLSDAISAADYAMIDMYGYGVMSNEDGGADLPGFKGILTRWLNYLIVNHNQPQYIDWMQYNAWTAWNNRNSEGITGTRWGKKTEDSDKPTDWSASAAVALYQNTPPSGNLIKDAYHTLGAKDFDSCKAILVKKAGDGTKYIGNIEDGAYTMYRNVDFGDVAPGSAEFRVTPMTEGGTIEIRIGGPDGKVIGSLDVENIGLRSAWNSQVVELTEKVTGLKDLCLVYRAGQQDPFRLNSFRFMTGSEKAVEGVTIDPVKPAYRDVLTAAVTPSDATVTYVWESGGKQVGTGKNYEVKEADIGKTLTVTAIGEGEYIGTVISKETEAVVDLPADDLRNPYSTIEAESADRLEGPKANPDCLTGIKNGHSAVYRNLLFGEKGSSHVRFHYATSAEDAAVEIRQGSAGGKLLGTCKLPGTGGWNTWKTAEVETADITGRQDICLVFHGSADLLCNLDSFVFEEEEAAARNPYQTMEGEDADEVSGMTAGEKYLTNMENGAYAAFKNLRFGERGAVKATLRYATPVKDASVEIHQDSADGELLGICRLENTGGWENFTETTVTVERPLGRQDIYLVFRGGDGICNLDHLVFTELTGEIRDPYTTVEAEHCDRKKGCGTETRDGVTYLAGIQDGAWSEYRNLDFGKKGAGKIILRYASPAEDATIEIREGSADGKLLATCPLENTGDFWAFTETEYEIEPIAGIKDIYLVYHGASEICNMDHLLFGNGDI